MQGICIEGISKKGRVIRTPPWALSCSWLVQQQMQPDDFEELPTDDLKQICVTRGLSPDGTQKALLERLR